MLLVAVSTASDVTLDAPRTYGNWRQPTTRGLFGLGQVGTYLMMGGLIFAVMVLMITGSLLRGLVAFAAVGALMGLLLVRDRHGRNLLARISTRTGWWVARSRGAHLYRSGPLGRTPWGTAQLPGIAAGLRLSEHTDAYGRAFALLFCPAAKTYTAVLVTQPDGAALVDRDQADSWVAGWGLWLSNLADEPGLVAASVTIETAPDSGSRLRTEVASNLDPDAPSFAVSMLTEIVDSYPAGSARLTGYVAITFRADQASGGDKKRNAAEVGRDLAARLPALIAGLEITGAGAAEPLSAAGLCEVIRTAYDPAAAELVEQLHASGESAGLTWPQVGPQAHQAAWDCYLHDSGLSVTWSMSNAPRGQVQSNVLQRLLQPHRDITRKRVTMLYRPIDPAKAAAMVEADANAADWRANASKKPTARDVLATRAAAATAREEAAGAGLVNFAMLVTATVTNPNGRREAHAAIDALAATARIRLRPVFGSQDAAFAACLPLGLQLATYSVLPSELTEGL